MFVRLWAKTIDGLRVLLELQNESTLQQKKPNILGHTCHTMFR